MLQKYQIGEYEIDANAPEFSAMVEAAYNERETPICLCDTDQKLKLYIAYRHNQYILARWPHSGHLHNPKCEHFEAPDYLTGFGQVSGSAVIEDDETGDTFLKFGFPMSKGLARAAPTSMTNDKPILKAVGTKLTIRGLLHFLWDRSHLTHWHPKMYGKRNWFIVRKEILNAAQVCKVKGHSLRSSLFLPENFSSAKADEIKARAAAVLGPCYSSADNIMIMIGEVKSIQADRFRPGLTIRHSADRSVSMDQGDWNRFEKRFSSELMLHADDPDGHLIFAGTFSIGKNKMLNFYEMTLMPVSAHWLPYEDKEELELIRSAVSASRRFVKGLRYNLDSEKPIASISLRDTGKQVTAVHLANSRPNPEYDQALAELMQMPGVNHIIWRPGQVLPF
ncbi:MAG: DUF1173 domain-containing protein [Sphingomonadales bacterium]|nr:DUF1173 domain-containing protein [Sphingomonadales bacterium]